MTDKTADIRVSELWIYPIKSLGGIRLSEATLKERGFELDRRWMLVDEDGQFLSQRVIPRMSQLQVELDHFGLQVSAPQMEDLLIPYVDTLMGAYPEVDVTVWGDTVTAAHMGAMFDGWFSEALGQPCRLVYMCDTTKRRVDTDYAKAGEIVSFADGFPLLLISEASLDDLNRRLESAGGRSIPMSRFRPNIVVRGCEPYAEDSWLKFTLSGVTMSAVKPCSRCSIPTIDPLNAKKSAEPLKTLNQYRRQGNQVYFGQNILYTFDGDDVVLREGDIVKIEELGPGFSADR